MVLQELVQPKALFFIGVYFGTGLSVAYLVVMSVATILSSIFSPKNTSVEEILAQMKEEEQKKEQD
jgi:hypothetical protein